MLNVERHRGRGTASWTYLRLPCPLHRDVAGHPAHQCNHKPGGSSSPGSGGRSGTSARTERRSSGLASPACLRKNSAAVSTAPTFCATADAIH